MNAQTIQTEFITLKKKGPLWIIILSIVAVIGGIVLMRALPKNATAPLTYHRTKRGDFMISIVEGGTLKAVHEITVRSELEGAAKIISIVPEGSYVKEGDLLVELDSSDLRERVNAQEVVFQNSQFSYVQGKESLAIQKSIIESNVKAAELTVEFAQSDLEKYQEGDWPQLKKNAETKITIAAVEAERAKDRLNWTAELQKKGYATKSELEADSLNLKRSEIGCDQAKEELRLLTKYDYPKRVRLLQANLDSAKKELERLKLRSASQVAQAEADLTARNSTLELHETRLNQLKAQLNLTKIYAPQDGLVIYASSSSPGSGVLIEEGAVVRQKQDIIKLPDISQMMVEIRVHESHVQKIKPGLAAYVTIDSLPDQQYKGTVRKVAVLPDSSSRYYNPNLKVYATEIVIEDAIPDLKPGISARAEIIITNLTDVLKVPIQAVTTVKGEQVCYVEQGTTSVPVPVEVGMYNDTFIEVKSGLHEGDRVLLSPLGASDNIDLSGSIVPTDESTNASAKGRRSKRAGAGNSSAGSKAAQSAAKLKPAASPAAPTNATPNPSVPSTPAPK